MWLLKAFGNWQDTENKAKLELSCEAGSLHMQLSAVVGHPDQPHFPYPPHPSHHSPSSPLVQVKKKSPSQLRRQVQRKCDAEAKASKTASENKSPSKDVEKRPSIVVSIVKETQHDTINEGSAVKLSEPYVEKLHQNSM